MATLPPPVQIVQALSRAVDQLAFGPPVTHWYNPLDYAWDAHRQYLERYAGGRKEIFFMGMNPGPWGMTQTGVPFGEIALVRDWLGISAPVRKPALEHPKRLITGFSCTRSEVSGARFWGWARDRWGTPERFFARCYVHNYCPLTFMEASGSNFTPNRLPKSEREPLLAACSAGLRAMVEYQQPAVLAGIGEFAEKRLREVFPDFAGTIVRLPHPSPASPAANRNWAGAADAALAKAGIVIP